MKLFHLILPLLVLALPVYVSAQEALTYSKVTIRIAPKPVATKTDSSKEMAAQDKKDSNTPVKQPSEILPVLQRTPKEFTVEMRPLQFLAQKDFIAHQPFGDKEGMLIMIDPSQTQPLGSANLLGKVDVLLVKEDGFISQIAPNVNLRNLDEPIDSGVALHAFVFLKAGTTKTDDIQPGDRIEGSMFKTHPVILQAPEEK